MAEKILLKKYSNRRLYDTRSSHYVTLEDLTGLIKSGNQVEIVDAATKEDVSAYILTQIILEEARKKNILLPVPVLHLIIQHGDDALGEFFDKYLHKTIQNYLDYKKAFDDQLSKWLDMGANIPNMMQGTSAMESFMQMFVPPGQTKPKNPTEDMDNEVIDDK